MSKWTPEQEEAINKSGCNIIVSAGAGSGKTAVLSERVLTKIKSGIHINELLILTFTKAAASEMKDRIRKKISKDPTLIYELNLLNSSYITTFDSYALSVLKKYHYLLNISNDIKITDESLVLLEEKRIMDEIFENRYLNKDADFKNFISCYCVKNDKQVKKNILDLARNIDNNINKIEYLENIKNHFFDSDNIELIIKDYQDFINNKKRIIKLELDNLNYYFDSNIVDRFTEATYNILNSEVSDLHLFTNVSLPRISRYPSEESKKVKENFKKLIDDLLSYSSYGTIEDIKNSILNNKNNINVIISLILEYIEKLKKYKIENNIYTFSDIASLSIKLLKNNENVREEIKNSFKEIMIDEYQDTNDIQDIFISLIENNNVYMVGDIKQSIYKFRGSNPNIFKEKYDNYSNNKGGYKIDLIKNFRSREEVLNNINRIFELIMDDNIGGARYKESHEMVYGKKEYSTEKMIDYSYSTDILEYDKVDGFNNTEIEIFSIAQDIKEKMNSNFKIFDKDSEVLRNITYNDIVIILDRSKNFDNYKKIFEYLGIPLTILKDEKLNTSTDILLIKNIFDFIIRINNKDYEKDFKYDFLSIGRSFLYEYNDEYLFDVIKNNKYFDTKIYKDFSSIKSINSKTSSELFDEVINITNYYEKLSKLGDYENTNVRIISLYNIANNMNNLGLSISEFIDYLENINEEGIDIKYNAYKSSSDSVKIMTIHKSKGLEYPICYFADLDHKFNLSDSSSMFINSNKYGIIIPNSTGDNDTSILKELYKSDYIKEEISEKIRLFYVALTRAREKIIIVLPKKDTIKLEKDENGVIDEIRRLNFLKLSDFIYSIKDYLPDYFKEIDINKINLSKNYLYSNKNIDSINYKSEDIIVDEIKIENDELIDSHFSKQEYSLVTYEERKNMLFGTSFHKILEYIDFKKPNLSVIDNKLIRDKIESLLKNKIFDSLDNANIYKEYEFIYEKNNIEYHGIIDLIIERENSIDIVDYKLKNINDENYIKQLIGYKEYIENISNKKINLYLYSIMDNILKEIK